MLLPSETDIALSVEGTCHVYAEELCIVHCYSSHERRGLDWTGLGIQVMSNYNLRLSGVRGSKVEKQ